ncbi:MAG TPA: hypothetical protein VK507_19015 [Iamia sp.]|nr:hypothetical protein [Iamia sp.]
MSAAARPAPASDPVLDYLLGPARSPQDVDPIDRAAMPAQAEALVTGRPVIVINPSQADAFGRFLRQTGDQLDAARSHLRRVDDSGVDPPPELRRVIGDVAGAARLLTTTARSLTSGTAYASRVAQLARRADEGGGLSGLQAGRAGKNLVTFAADPTVGGGAGALARTLNTAVGATLVGRTAEVVVDALAGAARRGLGGGGAQAAVRALGEGLRGVVAPTADFERLRAGSLPGPEAGRSARLIAKIARFAGPASVALDAFSGVRAIDGIRDDGLKASNGLALGSAATGLGSAALVFVAPWAAAGLGGVSLLTGGGSIFAQGKEDDATRRRAAEAWQAKLRRNPNTTDFLRGQGPMPSFPPLLTRLPRLSPTSP